MQGTQVPSLVGELRSRMSWSNQACAATATAREPQWKILHNATNILRATTPKAAKHISNFFFFFEVFPRKESHRPFQSRLKEHGSDSGLGAPAELTLQLSLKRWILCFLREHERVFQTEGTVCVGAPWLKVHTLMWRWPILQGGVSKDSWTDLASEREYFPQIRFLGSYLEIGTPE